MKTDSNEKLMSPKYRDKWVAIENKTGKVVGVGKTAKAALEDSKNNGIPDPVLTRIPKNYGASYVLITF